MAGERGRYGARTRPRVVGAVTLVGGLLMALSAWRPAEAGAPPGGLSITLSTGAPVAGAPLTVTVAGGSCSPSSGDATVTVTRPSSDGDITQWLPVVVSTAPVDATGAFATDIEIPTSVPQGEFHVDATCPPPDDGLSLGTATFETAAPEGFAATLEPRSVDGSVDHTLRLEGAGCVAPSVRYFVVWGGFLGIPTAPDDDTVRAAGTVPVAADGSWSVTIELTGVDEPTLLPLYVVGAACAYDDGAFEHRAFYDLDPWEVEVLFPEPPPAPPAPPQSVPPVLTG